MDLNELVHQVTRHEVEEAAAEAGFERATRATLGVGIALMVLRFVIAAVPAFGDDLRRLIRFL